MIHINRNRTDEQGKVIQPHADWFQAAQVATETAKQERNDHKADRAIYAHDQARMALEKLFHEKCAYCESELRNVEWDVEHFRPKGSVAECPDHPGYYWLAYEWTNLYPACKFCNQQREDKPSWDNPTTGGTGGKATKFPLADETTRVMSHLAGNIADEQTLLLDPCTEDPERHLLFDPKGNIYARNSSQKGEKTIEICFLQRRRLSVLRKEIIDNVARLMGVIHKLEQNGGNSDAIAELRRHMRQTYLEDNCTYAAVARAIVRDPAAFGL
jgi:uncharacterized protein (TIGR02646 family)